MCLSSISCRPVFSVPTSARALKLKILVACITRKKPIEFEINRLYNIMARGDYELSPFIPCLSTWCATRRHALLRNGHIAILIDLKARANSVAEWVNVRLAREG